VSDTDEHLEEPLGLTFGEQLRDIRETIGLSQRAVTALTGNAISGAALSRIERNERYPTLHTIESLVCALGLRVTVTADGTRVTTTPATWAVRPRNEQLP
jgi:transcriptional regulator with XRE-family HTH domain